MIHLLQYLCPEGHCIMGAIYDDQAETREHVTATMESKIKALGLNTWCGICGSPKLSFDDQPLPGMTMKEAFLNATVLAVKQASTLMQLEVRGETYDAKMRNARNN